MICAASSTKDKPQGRKDGVTASRRTAQWVGGEGGEINAPLLAEGLG